MPYNLRSFRKSTWVEMFLLTCALYIPQVSELVGEYKREHLTVWGNADYEIVQKCHKEVRTQ